MSAEPTPTPSAPELEQLRAIRRALLDVHRALLQTQRAEVELITGPMSPHEALSAAISDPRFAWLRALSELITQIDALVADDEPEPGLPADLLERTHALVGPPDPDTEFGRHYLRALQLSPDVVLAHRDLTGLI
jgi:hypothetical protein